MGDTDVQAAIDELYAVPLDDFVAERKRVASELRSSGARPAATEIAKLPKPTAPAWALNFVAREEPEAVGDWLEAAEQLREASTHAAEVGGDALRAAMAGHRSATASLAALVRERAQPGGRALSEPMLDRVRALLQAATADPELAEQLRAGRISEAGAGAGEAATGAGEPAASAPRAKPAKGGAAKRGAAKGGTGKAKARVAGDGDAVGRADADRAAAERAAAERAERIAELERRVTAAVEEAERAAAAVTRDAEAAEAAGERLEEARRTLHRSESEAAAARAAAEDSRRAAADAEQELEQLRTELRRAAA